ncbi:MAG: hypothetical protein OXI71_04670 [Gemmatimonadota bacterium]|nr:hypothetical protein [Gemmatimonadota bacterium]
MNVDLVDHLVCPRCGPPNGLLLLAHDVRDRRVREGEFGCPNCRDRFPVVDGFGDLRPPPREVGVGGGGGRDGGGAGASGAAGSRRSGAGPSRAEPAAEEGDPAGRALRIAAALGVTGGPGLIVVTDAHRAEAVHIARLVRGIEVLVVGWGGRGMVADTTDAGGVSAFVAGPRLPLRDGAVRGVVADGDSGGRWWDECRRVLMAGGRIAITEATREAREWVGGAGLVVVLDEDGMVVGAVPVPGGGLKLTGLGP